MLQFGAWGVLGFRAVYSLRCVRVIDFVYVGFRAFNFFKGVRVVRVSKYFGYEGGLGYFGLLVFFCCLLFQKMFHCLRKP